MFLNTYHCTNEKNCLWVWQRVILDAVRKGKLLLFRLINAHFYTTHITWISNPLFPGWIEIYIMIYMYIYINTYTFICHKSTRYKDLGLTEKNTELMPLAKKEKIRQFAYSYWFSVCVWQNKLCHTVWCEHSLYSVVVTESKILFFLTSDSFNSPSHLHPASKNKQWIMVPSTLLLIMSSGKNLTKRERNQEASQIIHMVCARTQRNFIEPWFVHSLPQCYHVKPMPLTQVVSGSTENILKVCLIFSTYNFLHMQFRKKKGAMR